MFCTSISMRKCLLGATMLAGVELAGGGVAYAANPFGVFIDVDPSNITQVGYVSSTSAIAPLFGAV
jgi:hypothetical protein